MHVHLTTVRSWLGMNLEFCKGGPEQQSGNPSVCLICSNLLFKASVSCYGLSATWSVDDKEVLCVSIFFHDCICDTLSLSYFPGFCAAELYSKTGNEKKKMQTHWDTRDGLCRKSSDRRRTCRDSNTFKLWMIISQKNCPSKLLKSCLKKKKKVSPNSHMVCGLNIARQIIQLVLRVLIKATQSLLASKRHWDNTRSASSVRRCVPSVQWELPSMLPKRLE